MPASSLCLLQMISDGQMGKSGNHKGERGEFCGSWYPGAYRSRGEQTWGKEVYSGTGMGLAEPTIREQTLQSSTRSLLQR